MPRLVQKCGYIKKENAGRYLKYIATREGVEKLPGDGHVTEGQQRLIRELIHDFPDAAELFAYEDYCAEPTAGNASAFISAALDANAHSLKDSGIYMKYISTRPRVEKIGEHGLFSSADSVDLEGVLAKLESHTGNVWTMIYSLRREDAARLCCDNAQSWRRLLTAHQEDIGKAMHIPTEQLNWYAAYHDESYHPHIHMMIWSDDPKQGYLTKAGIAAMRSALTNDIFQDELLSLYKEKDLSYKKLTRAAKRELSAQLRQMEQQICDSPVIEEKMTELVRRLGSVKGKKQYGYLKKPLKDLADSIVDELAKQPAVAQCYEAWNKLRDELESYYHQKPRERLPLSQQKEFRAVKNMVIHQAEDIRLGVLTFEDERMDDEPEEEEMRDSHQANSAQVREYQNAKAILRDEDSTKENWDAAVETLKRLWDEGYPVAAHLLGKLYRDGKVVQRDLSEAEPWFLRSAEAGNDYSEYALGKLLLDQQRTKEAISWLERAAERRNQFAQYRLGKLYLCGDVISKDVTRALGYLADSAEAGNSFAQYILGKLYLQGQEVPMDKEAARYWLTASAAQGNEYAQFFLDRFDRQRDPSVLLAATQMLCCLSRIFRDNSVPPPNPKGIRIDSRRRKKLMEKRLAMGHKLDDHEEQEYQGQMM